MGMWAREAERPDWDGLVVDLIEDDIPVGMAYEDDGEILVEFFADSDGEGRVLTVTELQVVLDTVTSMFGAEPPGIAADAVAPGSVEPVDQLASEFDALAALRGDEDEGFYPLQVARQIVARCDSIGLAVTRLEAFKVVAGHTEAIRNLRAEISDAHAGEPWSLYRSGCNTQAAAVLERWTREGQLVVAIEIEDPSNEVFVL